MHILFGDLLGLGHSTSSFGYTLALILTWFVSIPALATFLIGYSVIAVLAERKENQARMRAYDERRATQTAP
jgi:hypothetical protein